MIERIVGQIQTVRHCVEYRAAPGVNGVGLR